jgi:hypothetical protein
MELHHNGQNPDSPLDEMTRTDHRLGENFAKNHENTGQAPSKIDRNIANKERANYWKEKWDKGRWNDDNDDDGCE